MTKEELKQEAEEKYHNHKIMDFQGFYNHHYYYLGYVESAEPREKRIEELEAQIEKMKNCRNCKKLKKEKDGLLICTVGSFYINTFGNNCDKWEIKENG